LGFEWGFRPLAFLQLQADTWRILEGVGLALCLSQWGKLAYRRPRPALYRAGPPWNSADAWMSFPSGHTTIVAAAWSAYGAHLWKEDVPAWWRWGVLALGSAWTVSTALGRVWGGAHFPTDVMAGAILGVGSGVLGHVIWQ
jgi:undecaprenyl-diphosphatase